jgi:ABC-type Fe3+/spermidine/putrescine transport system ATPase subunit
MSDTVAVMNEGKIIQIDAPKRIYEQPVNRFVADFIGAANLIAGAIASFDSSEKVCVIRTIHGPLRCAMPANATPGTDVLVSVKPDDIQLTPVSSSSSEWVGRVDQVSFLGGLVDYQIFVGSLKLRARVHSSIFFQEGDRVHVAFQPDRCSIIPNDNLSEALG